MVRIFFIVCIGVLCSCSNNSDCKKVFEMDMLLYQINNEDLVHEIEMFLDSVQPSPTFNVDKKFLKITVIQKVDTTLYTLYYPKSAFGMIMSTTIYSKVKETIVALSFYGMPYIALPDSLAWQYLKEFFPKEYSYYQENNDFPPPPTGGGQEWKLIFHNDRLISKKIYYSQ